MTWMGEGDRPENSELTDNQKLMLAKMSSHLDRLSDYLAIEPVDPKVEAHLRMAADCLREQVDLDKFYPWEKEEPNLSDKEYLFLDNKNEDVPTVEDMNSWFDIGDTDDGDSK